MNTLFMKKLFFWLLLAVPTINLLACGAKPRYLVEDINTEIKENIQFICLNKAISDAQASSSELSDSEKELLGEASTVDFLFWGSMSGPKPVVNARGLPSEAKSLFPSSSASEEISNRYVLCLLKNGYE